MKLTAVLLIAACLQGSARGYTQVKVSLTEKDAPLEKVFKDIQKKTNFYFVYYEDMLTQTKNVTLDVREANLENVLNLCFKNQPLSYDFVANAIVVKMKAPEASSSYQAISFGDIHGSILGEDGTPVSNATILVKGTNISTLADNRGHFILINVDDNATIVVSSVGYEAFETTLKGRKELSINLKRRVGQLDEMQVIAYGSVSKRLNTGDVTTITGKEIQEQPVTDPLMALEGRVPGLYIQQYSGIPGAYSTVRIMGQNSIANGNNPLYIIDGIPFTSTSLTSTAIGGGAVGSPSTIGQGMSPFNSLNPDDIESIEVLKDADATAIYGSRGANGVIIITTRKGKGGNTKFDINVYGGAGQITRTIKLLNTSEYLQMRNEAFSNDGVSASPTYDYDLTYWDTSRYTDWQKKLIGNSASFTNAQANISGGNANTQFLLSGGYSTQGTVFPGSFKDQKSSLHVNLTHASQDHRFHAQFTATYVNDNSNLSDNDLTGDITYAPDAPAIYSTNGQLNWQLLNGRSTWYNPLAYTARSASAVTDNLLSNLILTYQILPGLDLKGSFGYNNIEMNQTLLNPETRSQAPPNNIPANSSNYFGNTDFKSWIIEPQLSYQKKIGKGNLQALIGSTFQQNMQNSIGSIASGFSNDALIENPLAASTEYIAGTTDILYHYDALFGRLNYTWNEKYLIDVTARRDGSSRFGPGKQFGDFGAVGAGWIFSKENFVRNKLPFLSFGKLRASYGTMGNDQITDYQYLSSYSSYTYSYQGTTGLYPTRISNPYYGWELVKKEEGGIELGLDKDRILFSTTYYRNRTGNQLVAYSLPALTGFGSIQENLPAIVQNTGIEFELNTVNIRSTNFKWSSSINLTLPQNKLISYPNLATSSYKTTYAVGQSLFVHYVYHSLGVNPTTGVYQFQTKNSNGLPTSPQDYVVSKPITQKFYGGVQNSLAYKGFQLDIFVQFVNQLGRNYRYYFNMPGLFNNNEPTTVLSRWQSSGDIANIQKFSQSFTNAPITAYNSYLHNSDATISSASFIRLKNIALSYTFPASWQSKLHLQNARVYIQGQNLLTITKYLGLDPETQGLNLPPLRMLTAGIQLTL